MSVQTGASFLVPLLLGYLALMGFMYFSQHGMLYLPEMPSRVLFASPRDIGLDYSDLQIETSDGLVLHGWYIPSNNANTLLLFLHGNAGNISHRLDSIHLFNQLGLAVLIIDYRGYGQSQGRPSELGTYLDAQAALQYAKTDLGFPMERIIVFGRSLGGAIAVELAYRHPSAGLILESSFTSVPDLAARLYPWLPVRYLSRFEYNAEARIGSVNTPVLIIHSRDDEIISYQMAEALFAAARQPKTLLSIHGSHNDGFLLSREQYVEGLQHFLESLADVQPNTNMQDSG